MDKVQLTRWLERQGFSVSRLEPLAGDVSRRRYHRVFLAAERSAILAIYPPDMVETCSRFLATTALFESAAIRVPRVLAASCKRGLMLLEDLGRGTLYDLRDSSWTDLAPHFKTALSSLQSLAKVPIGKVARLNPALDDNLLRSELKQTWDTVLIKPELSIDTAIATALRRALDQVCSRMAAMPKVVCHRDFMARNLVPLEDRDQIAVLDHQDTRPGPYLYDVASLLNDSLFPPPEIERQLLERIVTSAEEMTDYRRCVVQRTLKAAGTFAAFSRRGFDRHIALIAQTLSRAANQFEKLPEGERLPPEVFARWRRYRHPANNQA